MMDNRLESTDQLAENLAEGFANSFMQNNFGDEFFIGSTIEELIQDYALVNYQDVDDPEYFGAAIFIGDKSQIVINTHQRLRTRYYSVAHELCHILVANGQLPSIQTLNTDIEKERAADHFAAALMLPSILIRRFWNATKVHDKSNNERIIFRLADLSSMPYEAVERRVRELKLTKLPLEWKQRTESDWITRREQLGLIESPLDFAKPHVGFSALSQVISDELEEQFITTDDAIAMLQYADPEKSTSLWEGRQKEIAAAAEDDD